MRSLYTKIPDKLKKDFKIVCSKVDIKQKDVLNSAVAEFVRKRGDVEWLKR